MCSRRTEPGTEPGGRGRGGVQFKYNRLSPLLFYRSFVLPPVVPTPGTHHPSHAPSILLLSLPL